MECLHLIAVTHHYWCKDQTTFGLIYSLTACHQKSAYHRCKNLLKQLFDYKFPKIPFGNTHTPSVKTHFRKEVKEHLALHYKNIFYCCYTVTAVFLLPLSYFFHVITTHKRRRNREKDVLNYNHHAFRQTISRYTYNYHHYYGLEAVCSIDIRLRHYDFWLLNSTHVSH